jgi:hypothetical protein
VSHCHSARFRARPRSRAGPLLHGCVSNMATPHRPPCRSAPGRDRSATHCRNARFSCRAAVAGRPAPSMSSWKSSPFTGFSWLLLAFRSSWNHPLQVVSVRSCRGRSSRLTTFYPPGHSGPLPVCAMRLGYRTGWRRAPSTKSV